MEDKLNVVSFEDLKPILDLLTHLPQPTLLTDLPIIIGRLGWTQTGRLGGRTTLPVSGTKFFTMGVSAPDGSDELGTIAFSVSDTLPKAGKRSGKAISAAMPPMIDTVTRCLGNPPNRERPWGLPGHTWDLANRGQVDLLQADRVIELYVKSQRRSDAEMMQIRLGGPVD